jgi:hypothetical protein
MQNELMRVLSGVDQPCFLPMNARWQAAGEGAEYTFVSNGQPVYALFPRSGQESMLYINDGPVLELYTNETDCIQYLGTFPAGETVRLRLDCRGQVVLYTLDTAAFEAARSALEANRLQVTSYGQRRLTGTVTAAQDGNLYTSIPAIPGWTVTVDGTEVECGQFMDSLLTVPLTAGTHTVSMTYTPPGLFAGLALTGLGLLISIALLRKKHRQT